MNTMRLNEKLLKEGEDVIRNITEMYIVRINTETGHTDVYSENIELRNAN